MCIWVRACSVSDSCLVGVRFVFGFVFGYRSGFVSDSYLVNGNGAYLVFRYYYIIDVLRSRAKPRNPLIS